MMIFKTREEWLEYRNKKRSKIFKVIQLKDGEWVFTGRVLREPNRPPPPWGGRLR
jgi:hypothetical protein